MKQPFLPFRHELIVVNFAGGGGACKGIVDALGRHIDIAINHDPEAIAMHKANHPKTTHYVEDVFTVKPLEVTKGQPVGLAWFSPDCKHFSKAKGGKPVEKKIRGLAWVVLKWARLVAPRVIMLENVEEFQDWGPLDKDNKPCPLRKGRTFRSWRTQLENCGYQLEMREIRASVLGTPTIRKRLYIIARRDGQPIVWPKDTHGAPDSPAVRRRKLKPFRTAAECIDWSQPCPSIFERERPLAEATLRRIATGIFRYVINCADPFIVPVTHPTDARVHGIDEPFRTVTGAQRGELALITPYIAGVGGRAGQSRPRSPAESYHTATSKADAVLLTPFLARTAHGDVDRNGKRRGRGQHAATEPLPTQAASNDFALAVPVISPFYTQRRPDDVRAHDVRLPLPTQTTDPKHALVAAFLAQHNSERTGYKAGRRADVPLSTILHSGSHQQIVTSNLVKLKGTCRDGQRVDEPIHTIQAGGTHFGEVRAFLIKYYSGGDGKTGASLKKPMPTITTNDRIGLVTIHGVDYAIVDIGMRMLQPRELFRAQGFTDDYIIDPVVNGKPLTKTAQVRMCGNSVCPPVAEALVRANFRHEMKYEAAVA